MNVIFEKDYVTHTSFIEIQLDEKELRDLLEYLPIEKDCKNLVNLDLDKKFNVHLRRVNNAISKR